MPKHRVFIASAGSAKKLAIELKKAMESIEKKDAEDVWEIVPWFDETSPLRLQYGLSILEGLIKECKRTDLAVILMTEDDLKVSDDKMAMVPRDNCIFEAGLFMGGLGLQRDRSVILTSVEKSNLPVDLQSVHYIRIDKRKLEDDAGLKQAAEDHANDLYRHAKELKTPPKRPVLPIYTPEQLIELEKPESKGGDIVATSKLGVVVNTVQPVETNVSLAKRVVENMDAGIEYYYFFRAETLRMPAVAQLIQALVLAMLGESDDLSEDKRILAIKKHAENEAIVSAVKKIQNKLFIHLLPKERIPLYFCVHNALVTSRARCYLRYPGSQDFFIPWAENETAYAVAEDLLKLRGRTRERCIFYPTEYFDIYASKREEMELKESIENDLREQFNDNVYEKIRQYIFI